MQITRQRATARRPETAHPEPVSEANPA